MTSLAPPVARRPGRAGSDTLALVSRSLRRLPRQPDTLIISVALPIVLLLLFVYVFGGAIADGGRRDYLTYAVPGIIVLAAGWGATQTAGARARAASPRGETGIGGDHGSAERRPRPYQVRPRGHP
ncbi:ABC transporter permease [Frankia nepalensis]|uniref:ABC transporter permease n=1 Tax=Frankia nepalensis TaxID=1836974 RepID=UPI001EE4729F|nr:ABC transporter permease [Frankia nepalensis]